MALHYYGKRWKGALGRPPFQPGDEVTPNGKYNYGGNHKWPRGEYRTVRRVEYDEVNDYWALSVWNPSLNQLSNYNPHNFEKKEADVAAYERTKFFAARVLGGVVEAQLHGECSRNGEVLNTRVRDHKSAVIADVSKLIKHGEQWVILQTVAMVEGEEPRPPIRVTEYK